MRRSRHAFGGLQNYEGCWLHCPCRHCVHTTGVCFADPVEPEPFACHLCQPPQALLGELRRRLAPPTRSLLGGAHYLLALLLPASGAALLTFWPQVGRLARLAVV